MDGSALRLEFPAGPEIPGRARRAVREGFAEKLATPAMEELLLAVSEMVTMILRTATEPTVVLQVTGYPDVVRVEVSDGPSEVQPGSGGRVLSLVAKRWGVTAAPPTVWAEMATT